MSDPVARAAPQPTSEREPTVAYRDFVNSQFERVWDKFTSVEKAIDKADIDLTAYKLTANEFRGTLADQAGRLATKEDMRITRDAIEIQRQRIEVIEKFSANMQGKLWMLAAVFAGAQIFINLAQHYLK